MASLRFSSSFSDARDSREAEGAAWHELEAGLGGEVPSLVVAFATHHHGPMLEELGIRLARQSGAQAVIGCTAESVIGPHREIEKGPGIALWAASLPGTDVRFFETQAHQGPDGEPEFSRFPDVGDTAEASVLLVADPYSFPTDAFLAEFDQRLPGVPIMGGMASGATSAGQSLLFTADGVRDSGAVGVVLEGPELELCPIVSQGCRPVGRPWVITACERNLIRKLGGRPALEVLLETWNGLPPDEQKLFQGAPFIGLAIDANRSAFQREDFLVRGIMGLHQANRAVAVADFVRRGQTVQLLVRDAGSADEDLRLLLARNARDSSTQSPMGALLFSCNGRGSRMFSEPDHDVSCLRSSFGEAEVAGFFAAGEIGPVGGRNFVHGFTASVALFRERR